MHTHNSNAIKQWWVMQSRHFVTLLWLSLRCAFQTHTRHLRRHYAFTIWTGAVMVETCAYRLARVTEVSRFSLSYSLVSLGAIVIQDDAEKRKNQRRQVGKHTAPWGHIRVSHRQGHAAENTDTGEEGVPRNRRHQFWRVQECELNTNVLFLFRTQGWWRTWVDSSLLSRCQIWWPRQWGRSMVSTIIWSG